MTRAAILRDVAGLLAASLAALALLLAEPINPAPPAGAVVVAAIAAWVAWQDMTDYTIPDGAVAGLALLGIVLRLGSGNAAGIPAYETIVLIGFDAGLVGGSLLAVREIYFRRRGFDGLGLGDVKLAAAGAVLVGSMGLAIGLGFASAVAIVYAVARREGDNPLTGAKIAFGVLLGPAIALVYLAASYGLIKGPVV
jgi:leader peptidase (prepilin peptidase) / N-methyltransferase